MKIDNLELYLILEVLLFNNSCKTHRYNSNNTIEVLYTWDTDLEDYFINYTVTITKDSINLEIIAYDYNNYTEEREYEIFYKDIKYNVYTSKELLTILKESTIKIEAKYMGDGRHEI